ncbi:hypothetical protein [Antarcticirhabdus aurantiaca]|uniref:Uncharacterized protein n=1 Tax=Antarcticirhabdus aurantiaca TaxID=2606717 RepID=A0ACD4NJY8_9HYPH|nr:hypothetical protein [Antarcticirhabdus aurantiaca]WAJ27127.1 hypothetical protein OXU80_20055 [Jeongeuplla avenae]
MVPEIADELGRDEGAIVGMIEVACDALKARNAVHAVNIAIRKGLI